MMLLCYYVIVCGRFDRGRVWHGEKGLCLDYLLDNLLTLLVLATLVTDT